MYCGFLEQVLPRLLHGNPVPMQQMWWQQDGASVHNTAPTTALLNRYFGRRWFGHRGPHKWPPRSPDLSPLDFYLWGRVKAICYRTAPTTPEDMRNRIQAAVASITPAELRRVRTNWVRRLRCLVQEGGGHIEQLL